MNRKLVLSWRRFDFANSRHAAVNAAVTFPVFSISTITGFGLCTVQAALGNHRPAIHPITLFFVAVMLLHRVNCGGPNVSGGMAEPERSKP